MTVAFLTPNSFILSVLSVINSTTCLHLPGRSMHAILDQHTKKENAALGSGDLACQNHPLPLHQEDKLTGIVLCHRNLPCSMEMFVPLCCLCGNVFVCNCETVERVGYGCDRSFYVLNNTHLFLYFIQKKPRFCIRMDFR